VKPVRPQLRIVSAAPPGADTLSGVGEPLDAGQLYRRFAPYVAAIGLRMLGRDDEVEDLVQDVFLDAQRGLAQLREVEAVKGWLATVTVRKAHRRLRARGLRRMLGLDDAPDYTSIVAPGASPAERAMLGNVYRALDQLPATERLAWGLRYIEGERLERVAELCGCSLATAKRRIAAAQSRVTQEMDDA